MKRLTILAATLLTPLPAAAQDCMAAETAAYDRGVNDGVAAVNAQLGAYTARVQQQVQAQVNAQLADLEQRRTTDLDRELAEAQARSLAAQGTAPARMPVLPPLTRAPGGGIVPQTTRAPVAGTDDPASLPTGTTITITDPQNLPPQLYRALMDYAGR